MKKMSDIGTMITRSAGVLMGLFIIVSFLAPKSVIVSPTLASIAKDAMLMTLGAMLLVPWSRVRTPVLWHAMFALLAFCTLVFLSGQAWGCVWAFQHGGTLQKAMFPLLTVLFGTVLICQFPAIIRIKKHSNKSMKGIENSAEFSNPHA